MKRILTVPNCLTMVRIFGSITLIFVVPLSVVFFIIYSISGISDIFDGLIARATNTANAFGARLDSMADLLFYSVMICRLFPMLYSTLPFWIWVVVAGVLLLRVASYLTAFIKFRLFSAMHTYLNKATGLLVFATPYALTLFSDTIFTGYCTLIGVISGFASLEELVVHLRNDRYRSDFKSAFIK